MPIRVIGYFPTVRVTNDETVKIRKVGYQGPAGRPASDFNFSELANVADGAAPTIGRIPWGDGTLWQSVALTAALAGADPAGSAATAQAAAQAFATAADVTVLSTANSTAQGYANTAQTNAATRSDNASNLSTGTVPLGRLSGLTNAQLSATAGILSSQIAGLDASKITGTFPLSLMSQGTTGQFLRGDGAYSNTLTGGLTIGGHIVGAATAAFSGAVSTGALTVTGAMAASTSVSTPILNPSVVGGSVIVGGNLAWNASWVTDTSRNSIAQTTGGLLVINTRSANQLYIRQAGVDKVLLGDLSACYGTGGLAFVGASTTQFTTQAPSIGSRNAVTLNLNATGSVVLENGGTASLTAASSAVTLGTHSKIIYGSAGTTTAANNETVGTSTGPKRNASSGLYHEFLVAGTRVAQFGRAGLTASAESFSIGPWGMGSSYDNTKAGIEHNAATAQIVLHGAASSQIQILMGTGSSIFRMGYSPFDGGVISSYAWGIGAYAAGLTASYSGIGSSGDGSMTFGVATSGSMKWHVNTLLRRSQTAIGGIIIADLGAPVVLANSTTTTLMTATSRYGRLEIFDNTGQWATIRISNATTPVLEAGSANFAITASPTASQLGINLSAGTLSIITGSAAGTTISASFQGQ